MSIDALALHLLTDISKTPAALQLLLDAIPQNVFWKNRDSVYMGCNRDFAKVAGLNSPEEIYGLTDFDLPWTSEEAEFYRQCDRRVMDANEPEIGIIESQTLANGEVTWLETNKVPLVDQTGQVIGILGCFHDITKLKRAEQDLQRAHDSLEQRVEERTQELRHIAQHDTLTKLANRSCLLEHLNQAVTDRNHFGLAFIDLDRFKIVNDSLGHEAGDRLLIQVGKVLQDAVRETDVVARFGGDEFTILFRGIKEASDVSFICDRILMDLKSNTDIEKLPIDVSASIGIVIDTNNQYQNSADALRDADIAMYDAKTAGKDCYRIFADQMYAREKEKLSLELEIRDALQNNQFFVVYQPIDRLADGGLMGFECLARWDHPRRGLLSPEAFLPAAEETGMIVEMGEQILRNACRQLAVWIEANPALADLSISFNTEAQLLQSEGFEKLLDWMLIENNLTAQNVSLEITETTILEDDERLLDLLNRLHAKGHRLLLDDFGTGYSSLSYIHRFPVDALKIDKSFVQGLEATNSSREIARTIITLAEILGLHVIAEGVENEDQERYLQDLDCGSVQGFRYSKPLDVEQVNELLEKHCVERKKLSPWVTAGNLPAETACTSVHRSGDSTLF